ncbi:TOBE domain-containing protein [Magnetospirillum sp. 64-120]|uniref:TOBE domain-containing protein n=1 Tax=Magnetospirillum sp. 64-120 TaxID=1895778 RepID=UPI0009264F89|nr:TOBE domain-containing protein [Magnetospirillum sp. 64-120]OJX68625.1 MAG: molybdenum-dependent transcriptional regulator [Magnetospirillum sp. 64-120]
MSQGKVEAMLGLRREGRPTVGRDRIELLEAVGIHGSISKAAKAVGLSYKAAWDALNAVNNLLPRPAVLGQTGGRQGGGAVVTQDGLALIASFRLMEKRLEKVAQMLAGDEDGDSFSLLWSLGMKTSARNAFRCTVTEIRHGSVNCEVIMRLSRQNELTAIVTEESVAELGIEVGREITALVKSSFVMLSPGTEKPKVSARNKISGTISRRDDGGVNSEIAVDIGDGKTIIAIVTLESAREMDLKIGDPAVAFFKSSHVILAVD